MNSLYLRIYTDEDVYGTVARALRDRGYDAISTPEAGNLGQSDEEQLEYAISERRTIMTCNVGDFMRLHTEYLQANREHCGMIVSKRLPISEMIRRMFTLLNGLSADEMRNRLEFLTDWSSER